ncbi:hypothetical protein O181_039791 [Austropuccinia psidii MF-1]|uniref:Uncharacterized protein n=1 Tax=Austropuccinia psidii MF-1 TaxID=1389203 RepID=A0A9Q3DGK3_9BASI|nr:hypothetical protein [Austropuccinia psidii MF-1]
MSHKLTYRSIQNVQLRHHDVERGISPYATAPTQAHAHTSAPALAHSHAHAHAPSPAHAHAQAPAPAHAHAHTHTPAPTNAHTHAHANATAPHPRYCAAGSTSVICKITILRRQSPFMDDLVRSNPPSTSRLAEGPL